MSTIIVHVDFFIDFYGVSSILSTLFMLCGQIVDKLSSVDKFIIFSIFNNSLFYKGLRGYLPQQFLYFLPLPHGQGSFLPTFGSLFTTGVFDTDVLGALLSVWFAKPSPVIFTEDVL